VLYRHALLRFLRRGQIRLIVVTSPSHLFAENERTLHDSLVASSLPPRLRSEDLAFPDAQANAQRQGKAIAVGVDLWHVDLDHLHP
jgi:hypothetical protein